MFSTVLKSFNYSNCAMILVSIIPRIINGNSQKKKYVSRQVIAAKVTSEISFYVIVLCFMGKFYWHVLLPHSKDMFYDLEFSSCTLLCKNKDTTYFCFILHKKKLLFYIPSAEWKVAKFLMRKEVKKSVQKLQSVQNSSLTFIWPIICPRVDSFSA